LKLGWKAFSDSNCAFTTKSTSIGPLPGLPGPPPLSSPSSTRRILYIARFQVSDGFFLSAPLMLPRNHLVHCLSCYPPLLTATSLENYSPDHEKFVFPFRFNTSSNLTLPSSIRSRHQERGPPEHGLTSAIGIRSCLFSGTVRVVCTRVLCAPEETRR